MPSPKVAEWYTRDRCTNCKEILWTQEDCPRVTCTCGQLYIAEDVVMYGGGEVMPEEDFKNRVIEEFPEITINPGERLEDKLVIQKGKRSQKQSNKDKNIGGR